MGDEAGDDVGSFCQRFAMWVMPNIRHLINSQQTGGAKSASGSNLGLGSVSILRSLDDECRDGPSREGCLDCPSAPSRIQPSVVPAAKGALDIGMPTTETDLQIALVVGVPGPSGPGQRRLLDEEMGRDEDAAPHAGVALRQREGRDRGAIGMADQQAASQSREVEDLGKYGASFLFEKVGPAGQRHRA